jgi:hypothetical protein
MQVKCLELRDAATFIPVICIRPLPGDNEAQRYLLRRDGYSCSPDDNIIIMIDAQCRGCAYDPYHWREGTHRTAHLFIMENWNTLKDGDVIDCEFIRGKTAKPKISERLEWPL